MAGSPDIKVYNAKGVYIAACKFYEDAAALAVLNGDGTTIRLGHHKRHTVWTEGKETIPAAESYDEATRIMRDRQRKIVEAQTELLEAQTELRKLT